MNYFTKVFLLIVILIPVSVLCQLSELTKLKTQSPYNHILIGDANNDRMNELVVMTHTAIKIYKYNNVEQSFHELWQRSAPPGEAPTGFIGDADNDGKNELIIRDGAWFGGTLYVYKYNGTTWIQTWSTPRASQADPWHTWIGDADNDGLNELIVGSGYGGRGIEIYKYNGSTYSLQWSVFLGKDIYTVQTIDLDGDGLNELLAADAFWSPDIRMYKYTGSTYNLVWTYPAGQSICFMAKGGDIDNDGKNEILSTIHVGWGALKDAYIFEHQSGNTYTLDWTWGGNKTVGLPIIDDILNNGKNQFCFWSPLDSTVFLYQKTSSTYELIRNLKMPSYVKDICVGDVFNSGKNILAVGLYDSTIKFYRVREHHESLYKRNIAAWIWWGDYSRGFDYFKNNINSFTQAIGYWYQLNSEMKLHIPNNSVTANQIIDLANQCAIHNRDLLLAIGSDSPVCVETLLKSTHEQKLAHIQDIIDHLKQMDNLIFSNGCDIEFAGIDLDYEGFDVSLKPYFSDFVLLLSNELKKIGKRLSLTLQLPSPDGKSRFDYPNLFLIADEIKLMCYDINTLNYPKPHANLFSEYYDQIYESWRYNNYSIYSALNHIDKEKFLFEIYADKVFLAFPCYGYRFLWSDWSNQWITKDFGYQEIIPLLLSHYPYKYRITNENIPYAADKISNPYDILWYEDKKSLEAKLDFTIDWKIPNIALWQIGSCDDIASKLNNFRNGIRNNDQHMCIKAKCPVDLIVIDPSGLIISKNKIQDPSAVYTEESEDTLGNKEDLVLIPNPKGGIYKISVLPDSSALPSDSFSIIVYHGDSVFPIVANEQIMNIPSDPYSIEITTPVLYAIIDIKPGSFPNSINCLNQNGVIPVAILTTPDFDARTVNHTTIRFGPSGAKETHCVGGSGGKGQRGGSGAECNPKRHEEDVDFDGDIDLVFHFKHSETGLTCTDTIGVLTGKTSSGQDIVGSDMIRPVRSENQFEIPISNETTPTAFSLSENYPNPFNPSTSIRYDIPNRSHVKLEIFNTLGQKVATLVDAEQDASYYDVEWKANVSSGMYFYRLEAVDVSNPANNFVETKKMLLLK